MYFAENGGYGDTTYDVALDDGSKVDAQLDGAPKVASKRDRRRDRSGGDHMRSRRPIWALGVAEVTAIALLAAARGDNGRAKPRPQSHRARRALEEPQRADP